MSFHKIVSTDNGPGTEERVLYKASVGATDVLKMIANNCEFTLGNNNGTTTYKVKNSSSDVLFSVNDQGSTVINGPIFSKKAATASLTGSVNGTGIYQASQVLGGVILRNSGAGPQTDKMPSAADIISEIPNCQNGSSFTCIVQNNGTDLITLANDTLGTCLIQDSGVEIAQNTGRLLQFIVTNTSGPVHVYTIGTPTIN